MNNITKGNFGAGGRKLAARKAKKRTFIIILCVLVIITGIFISPLFNVTTIEVKGTNELAETDIIAKSGIKPGSHIITIDFNEAEKNLSKVPHISSAKVVYQFPNKIEIVIEEKMPIVYYSFAGGFVGINIDGVVTDIIETPEKHLPVAKGIVLETYSIGQKPALDRNSQAQIEILTKVAGTLYDLDMAEEIAEIDVSEITNILLYTHNGLTVKCGGIDELEYKFSFLKGVLSQDNTGGIADLSTPGQVILTIN